MSLTSRARLVFRLCTVALACTPEPPVEERFALTIFVSSTREGTPVPGARVALDGTVAAVTDEQGLVQSVVPGREGASVRITIECPEGQAPDGTGSTSLRLTHTRALVEEAQAGLRTTFRCRPERARAAILVIRRGTDAELPVLVNGVAVGRTSLGRAFRHLVEGTVGDSFRVTLDTSADETLHPRQPSQVFEITRSDDVFVYTQEFEQTAARGSRGSRRRRR